MSFVCQSFSFLGVPGLWRAGLTEFVSLPLVPEEVLLFFYYQSSPKQKLDVKGLAGVLQSSLYLRFDRGKILLQMHLRLEESQHV